jgi:hypothetical protein
MDASRGEPATRWREKFSQQHQRAYYVNSATGETSWSKPSDPASTEIFESEQTDNPLHPTGVTPSQPAWQAKFSQQHQRMYYVNTATGETSWTKPSDVASASSDHGSLCGPKKVYLSCVCASLVVIALVVTVMIAQSTAPANESGRVQNPEISIGKSGVQNETGVAVIDVDACSSVDCGGGAVCVDVAAPGTGYTCECASGFAGDSVSNGPATCVDTDGCVAVDDCGGGASCADVSAPGTGYRCVCGTGFSGVETTNEPALCTDAEACSSVDCGGGAECVDVAAPGTGYTCECASGYNGASTVDTAAACSPNSCTPAVTYQDGYDTLPTCDVRTTGSIVCRQLAVCASGYFGSPTVADVYCSSDDAELTVSGCTMCTSVAHSTGTLTCTDAASSQVEGCEAGFTLTDGVADSCLANICQQRTTTVPGYATLPVCHARTTGSIACSQLPECASGYSVTLPSQMCIAQSTVLSSACLSSHVRNALLANING